MNRCPICNGAMCDVFSATVLKKYAVSYRQCPDCGLLQTEPPYWLDEAYDKAIAPADTGLVMRNIFIASRLATLLYMLFDRRGPFLDMAGGYGMLTRLMRDYGFDYYWDDKHSPNLLARGFESGMAQGSFVALTAFEVLEHLHEPLDFIRDALTRHGCRTLIFTTELYEDVPPKDWWYYAFNTGQHISFYRKKTLEKIAERLSLNFHSMNGLHILTDRNIPMKPLLRIASGKLSLVLALLIRKKQGSLTIHDHLRLMDEAGH